MNSWFATKVSKNYDSLVVEWVTGRKVAHIWSVEGQSYGTHMPHESTMGMGPSRIVHGNEYEEVQERTYGPWIVVERRRNVPKI